jgi:trehalose/maltose hydrolase-like predicted phosphorylase
MGKNLGNVRYNYRWRRKSTARDPFQYFSTKPNLPWKDSRLNIGPKGFTGEKYGGSTYWDTEAYVHPFYMATKDQKWHATY